MSKYTDFVASFKGKKNPKTGKAYTFAEIAADWRAKGLAVNPPAPKKAAKKGCALSAGTSRCNKAVKNDGNCHMTAKNRCARNDDLVLHRPMAMPSAAARKKAILQSGGCGLRYD